MTTTWYHTVNGEIIGETTSGSRTSYLTDALGSLTATQGAAGTILCTYRFKPYGALLTKTGAGVDPRFMWIGSSGYRSCGDGSIAYCRSRHLLLTLASWSSVDALWPHRTAYRYGYRPTLTVDPFGNEDYIKRLSDRAAMSVKGTVRIADKISMSRPGYPSNYYKLWYSQWVDWYLSFAVSRIETKYDCGVSFTCDPTKGRHGWNTMFVGVDENWRRVEMPAQSLGTRLCGTEISVVLTMREERGALNVYCKVGTAPEQSLQYSPRSRRRPWYAQMAIGASTSQPKESVSSWTNATYVPQVGNEAPWAGIIPEGYTQVPGEELWAYHGQPDPDAPCDCLKEQKIGGGF